MTGIDLRAVAAKPVPARRAEKIARVFGSEYAQSLQVNDPDATCRSQSAALLLLSMLKWHGIPPRTVRRNADGKPFFVDENGNPIPPYFSISHDGGIVCCALAPFPLGVDLVCEPSSLTYERQGAMIERFLPPSESKPGRSFCEKWSRFEAYSKFLGGKLSDVFRKDYPDTL